MQRQSTGYPPGCPPVPAPTNGKRSLQFCYSADLAAAHYKFAQPITPRILMGFGKNERGAVSLRQSGGKAGRERTATSELTEPRNVPGQQLIASLIKYGLE